MLKYQIMLFLTMASILIIAAHPPNNLRDNPRRVNCMKYVFAPICRGAASKRIVTDINELVGDDPDAYIDEGYIVPNENHIKNRLEGQNRLWFLEKHFEKRFRSEDPEYETIIYPNRLVTN